MTNTYKDDAPMETKIYEELRCIRCVLERILREFSEGTFVDYQMEKYGKDFKGEYSQGGKMNAERIQKTVEALIEDEMIKVIARKIISDLEKNGYFTFRKGVSGGI